MGLVWPDQPGASLRKLAQIFGNAPESIASVIRLVNASIASMGSSAISPGYVRVSRRSTARSVHHASIANWFIPVIDSADLAGPSP